MPRFYFKDTQRPKRAAKQLHSEAKAFNLELQLTRALDVVSLMSGYRDWQELCHITGSVPPSALDDDVEPDVRLERHNRHTSVLTGIGVPTEVVGDVAQRINLTGTRSLNAGLPTFQFGRDQFRVVLAAGSAFVVSSSGAFELGQPAYIGYTYADPKWAVYQNDRRVMWLYVPVEQFDRFAASMGIGIFKPAASTDFLGSTAWKRLRETLRSDPVKLAKLTSDSATLMVDNLENDPVATDVSYLTSVVNDIKRQQRRFDYDLDHD